MAAAMADDMVIENVIPQHLESIISKLKEVGIRLEVGSDFIRVTGRSNTLRPTEFQT